MKVTSGLADVDFHIRRITCEKGQLIVEGPEGDAIGATVYVGTADIVAGLKALLRSPRALLFVLTAPLRPRAEAVGGGARASTVDDLNNPWRD